MGYVLTVTAFAIAATNLHLYLERGDILSLVMTFALVGAGLWTAQRFE